MANQVFRPVLGLRQRVARIAWRSAIGLLLPALALAGGAATIESPSPSGPVEVGVRWSDGALRLDLPAQADAYVLVRDGKAYSVANHGGRTMVLDMASLREMGQAMGGAPGDEMAANELASLDGLEGTGEAETVAGLTGELYRVRWTDANGSSHETDAVLSDDPLALALTRAFGRATAAMSGRAQDAFGAMVDEHELGVLRLADRFEVVSVSNDEPSAATFELPAEPMSLQDLMGGGGR